MCACAATAGLLRACDSHSVFTARIRAVLKTLKAANDHHKEVFVGNAVDAVFLDRAFLEMDLGEQVRFRVEFRVCGQLAHHFKSMRGVELVFLFFEDLRILGRKEVVLGFYHRFHVDSSCCLIVKISAGSSGAGTE